MNETALLTAFFELFRARDGGPNVVIGVSVRARIVALTLPVAEISPSRVRTALLDALESRSIASDVELSGLFLPDRFDTSQVAAALTLTARGFVYDPSVYCPQQIAAMAEEFLSLAVPQPALLDRLQPSECLAVQSPGQSLTYAQLLDRSNRLAGKLTRRGAVPGQIVAIDMERSADLAVAILAIWKAGAAYLPLDPADPGARKAFLLADSGAGLTLTDLDFEDLDREEPLVRGPVPLDSTAYVIYTSGSTGEPKGVPITHRAFTSFLDSVRCRVGIGWGDRFVAVTTLAFDISAMELMLPLAAGATLTIATRDETRDGGRLARLLQDRSATMMFGTPATWRMLLDAGWQGSPALTALCGGETLARDLAQRILSRTGALWNMYGPTETTVACTMARVESGSGAVPIGRALARTQLVIVEGELWIGGTGVASGYLNRPELTAQKFTPDGFFRTGDRVRFAADGNLEYLGRVDRQLKIHGFRIEPAEVEAALLRCGAAEAVVFEEAQGLTAIVTPAMETESVGRELAAMLPAHLVPGKIVAVAAFPLTANGKIDRRALANLAGEQLPVPFEEPAGLVEKALASIFGEVLQAPRVSATANFFHLGGHSLLAAQVLSRVWELWRVEMPARVLFEAPSLRALAQRIQTLQTDRAPVPVRAADRNPPLSFAQERLWFLHQFHQAERALYNIPAAVRLTGPLDPVRLTDALNRMTARHDVLRSAFHSVEGVPKQTILPQATIAIPILTSTEARAQAARSFDLGEAPLLRAALVRLDNNTWEFFLTMHHIVSDGWSMGVIFRELSALYRGIALPALPLQYADFAAAQRNAPGSFDRDLAYWRGHLEGVAAPLELPSDRPRGAVLTYRGARLRFEWPAELGARVLQFSRGHNVTPFITLLAAFQVLLSRYTGVSDLVVGTPVANRSRRETEQLIGFFVNTLPLRTEVPGTASFAEIVNRTRDTALDGYAHAELPFQKMVEALQPERNLAHTPFFQVMFALQNAAPNVLDLPGITASETRYEPEWVKLDLTVNIESLGPSFSGSVDYNCDLFNPDRMERMAGHLAALLEGALDRPESPVADLPMLTSAELRQLADWNNTKVPAPSMGLLERIAEHCPGNIAVECQGRSLTYADLQSTLPAANPNRLVPILVERNIDLLPKLLSLWKAGSAYVPIDPEYPAERQQFLWEDIAGDSPADGLAYVIYTSGSTGKPKGVRVHHRSLLNLLEAMRAAVPVDSSDIMIALATAAFDMSIPELWLPFYCGAKLVLATREDAQNPIRLRNLLETSGATVMQGTPTLWASLLDAGWMPNPEFKLLVGAEALPQSVADRLASLPCKVWNMFGPTETTVWSTMGRVVSGPVSIGRPMANTRLHVFDGHGHPVPIGNPGELYIAGGGVAEGYWKRPELTAERFVTLPNGERAFRTGDLVRYRSDGELEFAGRADRQVKLHGYRIELGEIEAALERHGGVERAAVVLREDEPGRKYIAAYYTGAAGGSLELHASLLRSLPHYMVPSSFVHLDALPLSANGKVDRGALRAPSESRAHHAAATGEPEELIGSIFSALLHLNSVTPDDNFFHLGGHSLLATRLAARLRNAFQTDLSVRAIFESPTPRLLARAIAEQHPADPLPPIDKQPDTGTAPLSYPQGRLWFLDRYYGGANSMYNIVEAFRIHGPLDRDRLLAAVSAVAARHSVLRMRFREDFAIIDPPRQLAWTDTAPDAPFDLANEWPVRIGLSEDQTLSIAVHHIAADAWSLGVIHRELALLYAGEELPPLALQYSDYAAWQRTNAPGDATWWQAQLAGAPALLELPTDFPRPAEQSFEAGNHFFTLPRDLTAALHRYCRAEDVTLFMILLGAFQILLARYTGLDDIVVGTPIANRTRMEVEGLVGFFANTLALRTRLGGEPDFREAVRRVRETSLNAAAHQDVPFEKLVEALSPLRTDAYTPVFQVLFILQNTGVEDLSLPGLVVERAPIPFTTARYDLTFQAEERAGELLCHFNYSAALFESARMERMAGHFTELLGAALAAPDTCIWRLPLLTAPERAHLETWNATGVEAASGSVLERIAQSPSSKVAVECEGETLTYAELARLPASHRVNQLVPVMAERTIDLIPTLLALWKAGSAYVPIDPEYPAERSGFMRDDVAGDAPANGLAYVIYTSGSTGQPKGVAVHHRSLLNLLEAMRTAVPFGEQDVMVALATAAFDMSVPELWLPLYCGAKLVLCTREDARDPARLRRLLETSGATVMQGTPTLWAALLDEGWRPPAGFKLLVGAERLPLGLANRLAQLPCTVWNMFGPTETTVWSTMGRVTPGPVTIGRPIANTRLFVLDSRREPAPVGIPGELYIAGDGVAEGYWRRPELTAERFVVLPNGERAFRTGDLVRYRSDGQLEYLGRADGQVKFHGYRIELGEIEAVLERHAGVERAFAAVREGEPGRKYLAAYFTGDDVDAEELRRLLERSLPPYMMPSRFMKLDRLPLSANGKVDRGALPEAAEPVSASATNTAVELLRSVFAAVLQLDRVGPNDSFFHLGGHSLLAARLAARIRTALRTEVSLRAIFDSPTPRLLAAVIAGQTEKGLLPPIERQPFAETVPLSFAQGRLLFLDRYHEGASPMYNIAQTFRIGGPLDRDRLLTAFSAVLARHSVLRMRFHEDSATVDPARELAWSDTPLSAPFDLANEWPIRIGLSADQTLSIAVHHIVADAWSLGVTHREVALLYAGRELPPLPLQYSDFAVWERSNVSGNSAWWQAQLDGAPALLELPTDRPRLAEQRFEAGNHHFILPCDLTAAIHAYARAEDATLFMVLLTAFQILLARYSGSDDIVVGTPVANRISAETEALVGLFANTLALRVKLAGEPDFREAVRRVREASLDAAAHQSFPFEKLVEAISPLRTGAYTPLFQALFILQNTGAEELTLPGLVVERSPVPLTASRYDLTFEAGERDGELRCLFNYSAALFDSARMERMAGHFVELLRAALACPETSVWRLPLLTDPERNQFEEWNRTDEPLSPASFVERFSRQAASTPRAIAVECNGAALTYEELDRIAPHPRSNRLIPITVHRTLHLLPKLLSVWKAGSAYVPIDPDYPAERRQFLRDDTAGESPANRLAYVIYTSGSTGKPKGVAVSHRSMLNVLDDVSRRIAFTAQDTLLAVTTAGFDISVLELWMPLLSGGRVVIATRDETRDPSRLRRLLESCGATVMQATPAGWTMLLESGWQPPPGFRILVGGEALPAELAHRLASLGCPVWNLYGPTETTIWSTMARVGEGPVTIGRPLANTRLSVLDRHGQAVPAGVPGELYIAGAGVAEGYWNRPELTASAS